MASNHRLRIGTLQYFIRPVETFDQFARQVTNLVESAADYKCRLLVFPEYFSIQLLTLNDVRRPVPEQVRDLARQAPQVVELFAILAKKHRMCIVGGSVPELEDEKLYNRCHVFGPTGEQGVQGKLHMTRWEREEWFVSPSRGVTIFETDFGRFAVTICYDVEFPEIARAAAREDCYLLIAPSCTDDRQGFLRVRYCAQARAIENTMYVVHSSTVGSLPMIPAVSLNYGQASILTPSDFPFSRDGILAEGIPNQEMMVVGEVNLTTIEEARESGTVLPLRDSVTTAEVAAHLEVVTL